jgi:hypothetical protein
LPLSKNRVKGYLVGFLLNLLSNGTVSVDWIAKFISATEDADGNTTAWKTI